MEISLKVGRTSQPIFALLLHTFNHTLIYQQSIHSLFLSLGIYWTEQEERLREGASRRGRRRRASGAESAAMHESLVRLSSSQIKA